VSLAVAVTAASTGLAAESTTAAQPKPAAAAPAAAPERKGSRQETIGVLTGVAVGAAAGGPIGAIVGAAAGAWVGDHYHRQVLAREAASADLNRSEGEKADLSQKLASLDGSLHDAQTERSRLTAALTPAREVSTEVSFRTDDAQLSEEGVKQLKQLGTLAQGLPDLKIVVAGYADPRGSQAYNQALSQRRADAVAAVLHESGVATERLIVQAHGSDEAQCGEGDMDGYALERRVTVQLTDGVPAEAVAQAR
jgi:outer membrane protein OmpA-like peptidoglycan-associated protein